LAPGSRNHEHDESPPSDDPLSSIRPERMTGMVAATIELDSNSMFGPSRSLAEDPGVPATHASGSFTIPVLEADGSEPDLDAPYELLDRIGTGGMGEVWRARQRALGRIVAFKRIRDGERMAFPTVRQFESEARLTGVLDHPNIVTVHELGHDQAGRVFYTMKLIQGTAWTEILTHNTRKTSEGETVELELRDHVDILLEVSQAIAFAHSRGIIHRDIKPGNVMIGDYGEVLVVDWGLAVALHPLATLGGAATWTLADLPQNALVCGTPAYMSPETALARRDQIGPATDVYLLGGVLFHVLYGRPPHRGQTVDEVLSKARANAWAFPPTIPRKLQAWDALLRPVIARALATEPELRYPDAAAFGEALRAALRNYDAARLAVRAQQRLAKLDRHALAAGDAYTPVAAIIAQLDGALEAWPDNPIGRHALAQAHLELATLALANNDLELAKISVDAYERVAAASAERAANQRSHANIRVTLHPVDRTLIGAPRPSQSLIEARTVDPWLVSIAELPASAYAATDAPAQTVGAAEIAARRRLSRAIGTASIGTPAPPAPAIPARITAESSGSYATTERLLDDQTEFAERAARLREGIRQTQRESSYRRRLVRAAVGAATVLGILMLVLTVIGGLALQQARDRAREERNQLSRVLLDETANTVEAELEILFRPIAGALRTTVAWAEAGELDLDDPRLLNARFMPVLEGLEVATSMLRADAAGYEYMLLRLPEGWRTRSTTPGMAPLLQEWSETGEHQRGWTDERPYDPHQRPWYLGGAGLRAAAGEATPIHWTSPYKFFTTRELGISASAPATSVSGREFVIAFDLKLGDLSSLTRTLPAGIERGQVFVLDEQLRILGLPRETRDLSPSERDELLFEPLAEIDRAPISRAAFVAWRLRGQTTDPFRLAYGPDEAYWVGFRHVERPDRPQVWIAVVVPESWFL
jgi:serine/threonine protein kinase